MVYPIIKSTPKKLNLPLSFILRAFSYHPKTIKIGTNTEPRLPNKEIFESPFAEATPLNRR